MKSLHLLAVMSLAVMVFRCSPTNEGGATALQTPDDSVTVLSQEITIEAPVAEVWEVLSNHDSYVEWAGVDKMEVLSENRELGAKRRSTVGSIVMEQTIDEFEPNAVFSYTVRDSGPFVVAGSRWVLQPDGERTLVTLESNFDLKFGLPSFLLAWKVRQGQTTALDGLKNYVQQGAS